MVLLVRFSVVVFCCGLVGVWLIFWGFVTIGPSGPWVSLGRFFFRGSGAVVLFFGVLLVRVFCCGSFAVVISTWIFCCGYLFVGDWDDFRDG